MTTFEQKRLQLQTKLETITGWVVYFKEPSTGMEYPCIKYTVGRGNVSYADGVTYTRGSSVLVTIITEDHEELMDAVAVLSQVFIAAAGGNVYIADGMYHYTWTEALTHDF